MADTGTLDDELLPLAKAAKLLPCRPSPSAVWRWVMNGCDANGERIRLPCLRYGRRLYVRKRDLILFGERLGRAHAKKVR